MLRLIERPGREARLDVPPSQTAVVSWNTDAPAGEIALIAHRANGTVSEPLPYVRWSATERRSLGGRDAGTRIEVDVLRSDVPVNAISVSSSAGLDAISVAVPWSDLPDEAVDVDTGTAIAELAVPVLSQYLAEFPHERGWCSAASLAMLLRYHGADADVPSVARAVFDAAYTGTGNWAFNAAHAGARGLRGAVAFLRGIDHAVTFALAGLPVAVSIGWKPGELTGAPVEHSDGHLLVVRGAAGNRVAVNDPAHPDVATSYSRAELDRVFRAHGRVAYLVAPRERTADLIALANARHPELVEG
jgi:hypothetical protein